MIQFYTQENHPYKIVPNSVIHGDCLDLMKYIPDGSIDFICTDLPYGVSALKWDSIVPIAPLWEHYERILKANGTVCLFGTEPFSSHLRLSNIKFYKYDWIWEKGRASGFVHAKNKPLKAHEIISVFSKGTSVHKTQSKNRMTYNPQMEEGEPYIKKITGINSGNINHTPSQANIDFVGTVNNNAGTRYPRSVIRFSMHNVGNDHPTQKPTTLLEYLIKTYTNKGDTILDSCAGSGSLGVAAINTGRKFILIEKEEKYYEIIKSRLGNYKIL
jgi:site-specific DNA-methyltransferase (adenine-specific)